MRLAALLITTAMICANATAQTSVPNTFLPGTPAKAADVNANFQTLAAAINALAARVDKLEGNLSAADFVGTYTLGGFQTEFNPGADFGRVSSYGYAGTMTLAADGSGTLNIGEAGTKFLLSVVGGKLNSAGTVYSIPAAASPMTWSYANQELTVFGQKVAVTAGGRMLVIFGVNNADMTNHFLILTRTK